MLAKSWGAPTITNDGVSIAREIDLGDPNEAIGANLVKEVAKADDVAGDGTTTATVLAWTMVREGLRNLAAGANPMSVKRGMAASRDAAVAGIAELAISTSTRKQIARGRGHPRRRHPEIGEAIAEAIDKVGKDDMVITVEEANTFGITAGYKGMRFDPGYVSPTW